MVNRDIVMTGVKIGEHSNDPNDVIREIHSRVIASGSNFVYIRPAFDVQVPHVHFIRWAEELAANKIYFHFGYTVQRPPKGKLSQFDQQTLAKIRQIAGEYFLGECISEAGCSRGCKFAGYFKTYNGRRDDHTEQPGDMEDLKQAHESYVRYIRGLVDINKELGMPHVLSIEASTFSRYNMEAGVDIPLFETINSDWDSLFPAIRGAARTLNSGMWGTLIAHEWYAGTRHEDVLKRKRLELMWKFAYMSGANIINIESGDEAVDSYGHQYGPESEMCRQYQDTIRKLAAYAKADHRPVGGPKAKVAFVSGLHDAWGGWGGSSLWNQFGKESWGHGPAEYSWRILDSLGTKRKWTDAANYGDHDLSACPAYGMFDIIPIEAPLEKLAQYDRLIFLGWNTMTDENMDKLTEYVRGGGRLLMGAAHLNYNVTRGGRMMLPSNEKLAQLFGCRATGQTLRTNSGTKFEYDSVDNQMLYPGTKSFVCDPNYSAGYTEYIKTELCGGRAVGYWSERFSTDDGFDTVTVIENKLDKGIATLITAADYPGHPAVMPLYSAVVREMITASARNCDIQVIGSDRVRYSVYEGDKMYLLNTDYDLPVTIKVVKDGTEQLVTLESLELKTLQL